ncbi:AMP-binding protein [Candidatus Bipolaricaulota bacterium]|nr:AMP-binding protein [Candidatus Bipolaricaulota bacterium]
MKKFDSLDSLLRETTSNFPESEFKTSVPSPEDGYDYRSLSFKDLASLVGRLAHAMVEEFGVGQGDKVAIIGRPHPKWAASFFAAQRVGATVVPIAYNFTSEEIRRVLHESEARLAIVQSDKHSVVSKKFDALSHLENLVVYGGEAEEGFQSWESFLSSEKLTEKQPQQQDETAVLMYTSGTTGHGKGVMLSHENLLVNVHDIAETLDVTPEDCMVSILPWDHIYGLTTTLLVPLAFGASMVYTMDYRNLPKVLKNNNGTILLGVPKLLNALYEETLEKINSTWWTRWLYKLVPGLLKSTVKKKFAGKQFRFIASGGAPLSPKTAKGLRSLGIGVMEGYGLTETSPVLTFTPDPFTEKAGSVGSPLPSVELKLEETDDMDIDEVLVKGPNVMQGYYKNKKKTDEVLEEDGWFHTGDSGYIDQDGWLFLNGRTKNVIVLESGNNVYPEEVEHELGRISYIEEVMVKEGNRNGKAVVSAVIHPDYEELADKGIKEEGYVKTFLWERIKAESKSLAPYMRIKSKRDIEILDEPFEKTPTQKVKRYLYQEDGEDNEKAE